MSKRQLASAEANPDEQPSRAYDLSEEIDKKLWQAKGICTLICSAGGDNAIAESASAAEDLIEGVEKALDELRGIERTAKEARLPA